MFFFPLLFLFFNLIFMRLATVYSPSYMRKTFPKVHGGLA
jgi:hypothetical protein